uniref:Uncharacterized protein n=1 Tax=Ralstonia solanacearum TaxID=305 RepID=A0A0S4VNE0_RALSL|nr:protein of unknown function [Ralstonia solanacearum]
MSWLDKLLPPKIQQTDPSQRKGIPEGLWIKCPACESVPVSYTHLRAHETDSYLVCRLLLEKKKKRRKPD